MNGMKVGKKLKNLTTLKTYYLNKLACKKCENLVNKFGSKTAFL